MGDGDVLDDSACLVGLRVLTVRDRRAPPLSAGPGRVAWVVAPGTVVVDLGTVVVDLGGPPGATVVVVRLDGGPLVFRTLEQDCYAVV